MRRWALVLSVLLAASPVVGPAAVEAQQGPPDLYAAARTVAGAWAAGDVDALVAWMADAGLHLELVGQEHPALEHRQARAALEEFHQRAGTGAVDLVSVLMLGGDPPRAYADFVWLPRPRGTSESLRFVIFVGLRRVGVPEPGVGQGGASSRWEIVELRVSRDGSVPSSAPPQRR